MERGNDSRGDANSPITLSSDDEDMDSEDRAISSSSSSIVEFPTSASSTTTMAREDQRRRAAGPMAQPPSSSTQPPLRISTAASSSSTAIRRGDDEVEQARSVQVPRQPSSPAIPARSAQEEADRAEYEANEAKADELRAAFPVLRQDWTEEQQRQWRRLQSKLQAPMIARMPETVHVFGARCQELKKKKCIVRSLDEGRGQEEDEEEGGEEVKNEGEEGEEEGREDDGEQEGYPQDDPMHEVVDQQARSRSSSTSTVSFRLGEDFNNDDDDMHNEVPEDDVIEEEVIDENNDGDFEDANNGEVINDDDDEIITVDVAANAIYDALAAGGDENGFDMANDDDDDHMMNNDDGQFFGHEDYDNQEPVDLDDVAGEEEVVEEEAVEGGNNDDVNDEEEGADSEGVDSDEAMEARRRVDAVDKLTLRRRRNSNGEYVIVDRDATSHPSDAQMQSATTLSLDKWGRGVNTLHGLTSSSQSRMHRLSNGAYFHVIQQRTSLASGAHDDDQPSTSARRSHQRPTRFIPDYELQSGELGMVPTAWSATSSFDAGGTEPPGTPDEEYFVNRFSRDGSMDALNVVPDDDEDSREAVDTPTSPPKKRGRGRPRKADVAKNQMPRAAPISTRKLTTGLARREIVPRDSRYPMRRAATASSTTTSSEKSSRSSASADVEDSGSGTPDPQRIFGRKRKSHGDKNAEGGNETKKKRRGRAPISAEQKERAMRELLEGPEVDYIDEVEFPTWLNYDQPVMYSMKAMIRFNQKKDLPTVVLRTQITQRDIESIRRRLKIFGKDWEKSKKKPNQLLGRHHFNGRPYQSHPFYKLLGAKEESRWTLQFFQASDVQKKKSQLVKIPPYISLNHNETAEMPEYVRLHYDLAEVSKEHCACDMTVGCQPDTCPCMKKSSLRKGIVVDTLLTGGAGSDKYPEVYECCETCSCRGDADKCESVVQFRHLRFQAVHTEAMGYALRVMQPVERGEPVLDFTGVRQAEFTKADQQWSYTCANGGVKYYADLVGMKGEKEKLDKHVWILNPLHKGNAARHICHSYWPNVEWCNVRRGGQKTTDPECIVYALEPLSPGDLLYLNYGKSFGIDRDACGCTQELCHTPAPLNWFKNLTLNQAMRVLIRREKLKRTYIAKTQQQAADEVAEEDFAKRFRKATTSRRKLALQRGIEADYDEEMREKKEAIERERLQKIEDDRQRDIAIKLEPVE